MTRHTFDSPVQIKKAFGVFTTSNKMKCRYLVTYINMQVELLSMKLVSLY